MNVNNGRTITVATAPVDGGGFLVDHERKARFAYGEMEDGREVTYRRDGEKWKLVHESRPQRRQLYPAGLRSRQ